MSELKKTDRQRDGFIYDFISTLCLEETCTLCMMFYLGKNTGEKTQGFNQSVEDNKNQQTLNNFPLYISVECGCDITKC